MMTGTIIGRRRVRSPTRRPSALRAWRLRTSTSRAPSAMALVRAVGHDLAGLLRAAPRPRGRAPSPGWRSRGVPTSCAAVEVDGGHHHDDALFGQHAAVAQHAVADVADGAVDVEVAGRHVAVAAQPVGVEARRRRRPRTAAPGPARRPSTRPGGRGGPGGGTRRAPGRRHSGRVTDSRVRSSPWRAWPLTCTGLGARVDDLGARGGAARR